MVSKAVVILVVVCAVLVGVIGCANAPITPPAAPPPTLVPTGTLAPPVATAEPVPPSASPSPTPTDTDDVRLWGTEISMDRFIELCQTEDVILIEWFTEPDRLRILTRDGHRYNYRNAVTKLDVPRVLQSHGITIGDNGIPLDFEV